MWRKITQREQIKEEHVGRRSWWVTLVTTLTLECGHQKVYRGYGGVPKTKVRCKDCAAANHPS